MMWGLHLFSTSEWPIRRLTGLLCMWDALPLRERDVMNKLNQRHALDALHDWSKWVIGLGFTTGLGCVAIFRDAAPGLSRTFLVVAISAFALSVLVAILLRQALALAAEHLPLLDAEGRATSIAEHRGGFGMTLGAMMRLQLGLLGLGAASLIGWVVSLPPA